MRVASLNNLFCSEQQLTWSLEERAWFALALIEAKDNSHSIGDGMQQALDYATTALAHPLGLWIPGSLASRQNRSASAPEWALAEMRDARIDTSALRLVSQLLPARLVRQLSFRPRVSFRHLRTSSRVGGCQR
jgi:hypothetical protein